MVAMCETQNSINNSLQWRTLFAQVPCQLLDDAANDERSGFRVVLTVHARTYVRKNESSLITGLKKEITDYYPSFRPSMNPFSATCDV